MHNSEPTDAANHIPESSEQPSCRETGNPPALGHGLLVNTVLGLMAGVGDLFQLRAFPSLTVL